MGFLDVELRKYWLLAKGNPLSRLDAVVDWERFRPLLDAALVKLAPRPVEHVQNSASRCILTLDK